MRARNHAAEGGFCKLVRAPLTRNAPQVVPAPARSCSASPGAVIEGGLSIWRGICPLPIRIGPHFQSAGAGFSECCRHAAGRASVFAKDQHIGRPAVTAHRATASARRSGVKRRIDMHFALNSPKSRPMLSRMTPAPRACCARWRIQIAELAMRAQRDFRVQPEAAHMARGPDGGFDNLLVAFGLGVDLRVGHENRLPSC